MKILEKWNKDQLVTCIASGLSIAMFIIWIATH